MASGSALPPDRPDWATQGDIAVLGVKLDALAANVSTLSDVVRSGFARVDKDIGDLKADTGKLEANLEGLTRRMADGFSQVSLRLEGVNKHLDRLEDTADGLRERMARLEGQQHGTVQTISLASTAVTVIIGVATFLWKTFSVG